MIRRDWIKLLAASSAATMLPIPSLTAGPFEGRRILFQGDSITDAGRNKEINEANNIQALGYGYSALISAQLISDNKEFQIYNKGISGHKVFQLIDRWQKDAIDIKPDVISILIGVNDFWHTLSNGYEGTVETYIDDYRKLIDQTLTALPKVKIIICEPFVVEGGTAITPEWTPAFDGYKKGSLAISKEFKLPFVPFQEYFNRALKSAPASYWCPDGVHPSIAGSTLMAKAWMETFKRI